METNEELAEHSLKRLRARLAWIVRIKANSSNSKLAEILRKNGVYTNESTIRKWLSDKGNTWIGGRHLWVIGRSFEDIRIGWLLGLEKGRSDTEVFIDGQMAKGK